MKFTLAILAVLAVAGQLNAYDMPSTGSGELAKDFQDIFDLIPLNELIDITRTYAAQDKEFQLMTKLVRSQDSKEFVALVEGAPEFKKLMAYVQTNGLDIYRLLNKYNEILNIPPFKPLAGPQRAIIGGLSGYVRDILDLVPVDKMMDVQQEKMDNSEAFKGLVNKITSAEFVNFYNSMLQSELLLKLENRAEQVGLDKESFQHYYAIFLMLTPFNK
ncbi:uncharacterized protein LOC114880133 [Osmia bicornis bicornis]|uniref:uncharacterized protein LOC114880133 n=1 Tax=Osmia bicornis bicornis TaxID=1437191 RepID=UPI001EAEB5CF|nr:uncharacterized protein LOC114880133 [Osmia bicornis bicornis]